MLDLGRYDEAPTLLARLVSTEPDSGRAWCLFARAHLGADRFAEAVEAANRAAAIEPAEEWPHRLASNALMHLGNHREALRAAAARSCLLADPRVRRAGRARGRPARGRRDRGDRGEEARTERARRPLPVRQGSARTGRPGRRADPSGARPGPRPGA